MDYIAEQIAHLLGLRVNRTKVQEKQGSYFANDYSEQ